MGKKRKAKRLLSLVSKRPVVVLLLLAQLFFYAVFVFGSSRSSVAVAVSFWIMGALLALFAVTRKSESPYKLSWIFFILALPLFGGFFYLLLVGNFSQIRFKKRVASSVDRMPDALRLAPMDEVDLRERRELAYLAGTLPFTAYDHAEASFLASGEEMFARLKRMLLGAERYIFLEYFLIGEGELWTEVLSILKEKAAEGVKVRIVYDDVGSLFSLPSDHARALSQYGIEVRAFNPFVPFLRLEQNNRDHRKIAVVDGREAITGGINLADEYINRAPKYGHWNDAAVWLSGKAAWPFTVFFLQTWEVCCRKKENLAIYLPKSLPSPIAREKGIAVPYADDPTDEETVGEQVYLYMIHSAKRYIYITTPYLIIGDKMLCALTSAAKSGVDVRILLPHHWDKRIARATTRTYYRELMEAGVRVYEYTPGFMHAKTVVSDDEVAAVGTVNFDFRSFCLHFECGVFFYRHSVVRDVKEKFLKSMKSSEKMTVTPCRRRICTRLWESLLRLLSPLL